MTAGKVDQSGSDHRITLVSDHSDQGDRSDQGDHGDQGDHTNYDQYIGIEGEALSFDFVFNSIVNLIG